MKRQRSRKTALGCHVDIIGKYMQTEQDTSMWRMKPAKRHKFNIKLSFRAVYV